MNYRIASNILSFCEKCLQTLGSIIKVLLLSRRVTKLDINVPYEEIVILGNGPSLKPLLENHRDFLEKKALLAVNYAVLSDYYTELRPEFYLVADPVFLYQKEHCDRFFESLALNTTWNLKLYLSVQARKSQLWQERLKDCRNIEVHYINLTPIEGFCGFSHWAFRKRWGMPRPRNVLIPSIMTALCMPFKTIYIAGADHSWLKEIWIDDSNVLMENLNHFYDKKGPEKYVSDKHLHDLLLNMHIIFKSYHVIRDYAKTLGKEIYNITEGSYIDAFERKKLS